MSLYLKIIFFLAVLITVSYRLITAMDTEVNNKGVMNSIKENFSGSTYEQGCSGSAKMTPSNFLLKDNSCSMLH